MKITKITENKRRFLPLLLAADEQEDMIDRYLGRGEMYVLDDGGVVAECVVTDEGNGVFEIKNLAVAEGSRGKGYGRALIEFVSETFKERGAVLRVGTGDSPLTVPFYEKCGFARSGVIENFFTENYDHPIVEGGVVLRDMIILQKELR